MMMGTADEIVKAPEKGPVFVEDLPEEEQAINLVSSKSAPLNRSCLFFSVVGNIFFFFLVLFDLMLLL